ncbi:amidohydrolase family protein [Micrococcus luteus]|uniref:amidohydrolase family protein n=1 Tax=Micrococcus luteus TaxID=1270 RepID=UPI0033FB82B3
MSTSARLLELDGLDLFDHHCHGVVDRDLGRAELEDLLTESSWPETGPARFDTQVGFAVRRWCAPALGLEPFAAPDEYVARRRELGGRAASERLLRAAGIGRLGIETGIRADEVLGPAPMGEAAGATVHEIVRLEREAELAAEALASTSAGGAELLEAIEGRLELRLSGAIGVKTIAAYRIGLDFDPARPERAEAARAAARWLEALREGRTARLADPVLIRHLIWWAIDRRTAIQVHIGYGDADVDLHRCSPLLLTELLRSTAESGARFMLLHCYPFHREAGYLADVFPHVYCDVGLAINYTGARSAAVIAESLELTPFGRSCFSTDAFGAAELYHLGAVLFRRGLGRVLAGFRDEEGWPEAECLRVAAAIGARNALRAYELL